MIRLAWDLLFGTRLDRMTANEIAAKAEAGELTFRESRRVQDFADRISGKGYSL
jgi:hypothetical protein